MLIGRGIKQKDIAKTLGVTRSCISIVINGHQQSRRVKQAVANALGAKVTDLWPEEKTPK